MYRKIRCNKEYGNFKILQKFLGTKALFSSRIFLCLAIVVLLFLFDNYCLIMDYLGLKYSSCKLQVTMQLVIFFIYI